MLRCNLVLRLSASFDCPHRVVWSSRVVRRIPASVLWRVERLGGTAHHFGWVTGDGWAVLSALV